MAFSPAMPASFQASSVVSRDSHIVLELVVAWLLEVFVRMTTLIGCMQSDGLRTSSSSSFHGTKIGSNMGKTASYAQQVGRIVAVMAPPQPQQRSPGATGGVRCRRT